MDQQKTVMDADAVDVSPLITEIDIASTNLLKLLSLPGTRDWNQIPSHHNRL